MKRTLVALLQTQKITRTLVVPDELHGRRLDVFLEEQLGKRRSQVREKIHAGQVDIDRFSLAKAATAASKGKKKKVVPLLKPNFVLNAGDKISLVVRETAEAAKSEQERIEEAAKQLRASIVFKDDRIVVVNKPHGLAVQGGSKTHLHVDALLPFLLPQEEEKEGSSKANELKLFHRLDKRTTGLLILARNAKVAHQLQSMQIEKTYWAVVYHKLDLGPGSIETGILQVGTAPYEKMKAVGTLCCLQYNVLSNSIDGSLIQLEPQTGRKHQLRVHCSQILKSPILGDYKYGPGLPRHHKNPFRRFSDIPCHLHLRHLSIKDWYGKGFHLDLTARIPPHFRHTLESYKLSCP